MTMIVDGRQDRRIGRIFGQTPPRQKNFGPRVVALFLILLVLFTVSGCRYPQDVEGTLDEVQGGTLKVGVTENSPWVIRTADGPAGLEAELIRELAERLDADIRWHWGEESELVAALEQLQLHLVIGGLTQNPRLSKAVALTKPYYKSRLTVGFRPSAGTPPESLEDMEVGVAMVNHLSDPLRDHGAKPKQLAEPQSVDFPVANATWWLEAHGFEPGPWTLATDKHVMALAKGENAWMMTVQRYLNSVPGLDRRLRSIEAEEETEEEEKEGKAG